MKKASIIIVISIVFVLLIISCKPGQEIDFAFTPTITVSKVPIEKNTPRMVNTKTPQPTVVPTRTMQPFSTSIPILENGTFQFPDWVRNPKNNIILLSYTNNNEKEPRKVGLLNPETGEQTIIELKKPYRNFYWEDAQHIVFLNRYRCDEPITSITVIDLVQGTLKEYDPNEHPELVQGCYSEYKMPFVRTLDEDPERSVVVVDQITGKMDLLTDPNDGITDAGVAISLDKKYAAIVQVIGDYQPSEIYRPEMMNQLSIYQIEDRKLIIKVVDDYEDTSLRFFPDNNNLVYWRGNTPCIIEFSSQSVKCFESVADRLQESYLFPEHPTSDSKEIAFIYQNDSPYHGGLCFFNIDSEEIRCPTDNSKEMNDYGVISYSLSPDEKFILFTYADKGCPGGDFFGEIRLAMMDIEGKKMYDLGGEGSIMDVIEPFGYYLWKTWRPIE